MQLRQDARALLPMVRTPWVRRFLDTTPHLPAVRPRRVFHDAQRTRYYSQAAARRLPPAERQALKVLEVTEEYYYSTRYGTPLAYARALDLVGQAGFDLERGARILDFGHGTIGHLRLLAMLGAQAVGVDVDPSIPVVYGAPGDQGAIRGPNDTVGQLRLVSGQFPADPKTLSQIGQGYALFVAKNTLKRGYIHPARKIVPPRRAIDLGCDDATFVKALHATVAPGGYVMIYNLYPRQSPPDKPYIPWADGQTPFARQLFEEAGFEVLAYDRDDTTFARKMGHALGWDRGPDRMDLENDLFAIYTLLRRSRH
jgi:SAM-dependent methyltransferase